MTSARNTGSQNAARGAKSTRSGSGPLAWLRNLKVSGKLALIVAIMAVPVFVLGHFVTRDAFDKISVAASEHEGANLLLALNPATEAVARHRGLAAAAAQGDGTTREALGAAQAEVETRLAALGAASTEHGSRFGVAGDITELQASWKAIADDPAHSGSEAVFSAHTGLIDRMTGISTRVASASGLSLDPEAATYALVAAAVYEGSPLIESTARMRGIAVAATVRGSLPLQQRVYLAEQQGVNHSKLDSTLASLRDAFEADPALRTALEPKAAAMHEAVSAFHDRIEEGVTAANAPAVTTAEVFELGDRAVAASTQVRDLALRELNQRLESRVAAERNTLLQRSVIALFCVALAIALCWYVVGMMSRQLRAAMATFERMAQGNFTQPPEVGSSDDIGRLLAELDGVQGRIRDNMAREQAIAGENKRIREALDSVSTNVMIADAANNIVYMNPAQQRMFVERQAEIREHFKGRFDPAKLMGSNMDAFHARPGHQQSLISGLRGTHQSQISMAGATFRLIASPIFDGDGKRIGTAVEWTDRTREVEIEREVQSIVDAALSGDLKQRIGLEGKAGFFQALSTGVNELVSIADRVIEDTVRVLGSLSKGDLTQTIAADYQGAFGQLKTDANATVARLTEVVGQIQETAGSVRTGADEIAQGNANLSQRTEEQASSLEETASSMEEMTSSVRQNADNASQANQLAIAARDQAQQGGAVVQQAVHAMGAISASSRKIADIIGVIDEIAFQTNLLALNASVEAARAGEQGRGFAVVASEVRNLAGRSAAAAKEIKELIQDSVGKVDDGSRLVTESGQTLDTIVASVKKVTDIVGEIAAASREQAAGIEEVNKAIMQMDELTQQNAALVEEAAAASESLGDQARSLDELMAFFSTSAAAAGAKTTAAPAAERRSSNRPWSASAGKSSAPAKAPARTAPKKAVHQDAGSDWEEF